MKYEEVIEISSENNEERMFLEDKLRTRKLGYCRGFYKPFWCDICIYIDKSDEEEAKEIIKEWKEQNEK